MAHPGTLCLDPQAQAESLKAFIAKQVRPFDPAIDDYDRPPFAADTKEGKNDSFYNAHAYHTKVPPRSIVPYILHYTQPGDLVVDPFCGSGMTGVAAQMCVQPPSDLLEQFPELKDRVGPRSCILNDLSPAACHISYNYNTTVDVETLKHEFERIMRAVKGEFDWLYGTEHYEPAIGSYNLRNAKVASRLKNPPEEEFKHNLLEEYECTWELLSRSDVEARLGYSVSALPRDKQWGDIDVLTVEQWICIPAMIQYTVWSDVYRCAGFLGMEEPTGKVSTRGKNTGKPIMAKRRVARGCGHEIVLWEAAVDDPAGDVREEFNCPACKQKWTKYDLDFIRAVPVYVALDYVGYKGKEVRYYRPISARELTRVSEIDQAAIKEWFPDALVYPHRELLSMGVTKHGVKRLSDFWTRRNLRALAALWAEANKCRDERLVRAARFVLTSMFVRIARTARYNFRRAGNSSLSGLLYISSITAEDNVRRQLETKLTQCITAFGKLGQFARCPAPQESIVTTASATNLSFIPDNSVDYVFADPPFGGNIFYSDASMLFEAWLDDTTDENEELVFHRRSKQQRKLDKHVFKELDDYAAGMNAAFAEIFRVLKPGRWATIEFNNSDGKVFDIIKEGIKASGFEIVNMLLLDKEQKSFKQHQGADGSQDVVDKDVFFNIHKPAIALTESRSEDLDLERQLADVVRQHLQSLPSRIKTDPGRYDDEHRTTATINSMLMNSLIPRGVSVDRLNIPFIERVCSRYFRKVGHHWYLRGESVGSENGDLLFSEEVDVKDEITAIAWLRQIVHQKPMLIGELKPRWMRATGLLPPAISQELSLDMLLSENFWRDPDSNRWREPTDEEREKMNDDRSIRVLHDAERYVGGSLHRTTTEVERCEWIDVLFKASRQVEDGEMQSAPALRGFNAGEGYRLITRLFQSVLRENVPATLHARAQKQAGAASNRISQDVRDNHELRKAEAAKDENLRLFDEVD